MIQQDFSKASNTALYIEGVAYLESVGVKYVVYLIFVII